MRKFLDFENKFNGEFYLLLISTDKERIRFTMSINLNKVKNYEFGLF